MGRHKKKSKRELDISKKKHYDAFYASAPPGMIKEKKERPEDSIPNLPENKEAREFLAQAPTKGLWMPLGKEVKVMQCWRCKNYGHRSGDKECPMYYSGSMQTERFRWSHEDPMHSYLKDQERKDKEARVEELQALLYASSSSSSSSSDSDSSDSSSDTQYRKRKSRKKIHHRDSHKGDNHNKNNSKRNRSSKHSKKRAEKTGILDDRNVAKKHDKHEDKFHRRDSEEIDRHKSSSGGKEDNLKYDQPRKHSKAHDPKHNIYENNRQRYENDTDSSSDKSGSHKHKKNKKKAKHKKKHKH